VVKAGAFGTLFGLGGTVIYGAVLTLSDTNFALLTILIGWLVGEGVRRGAEGRGGLAYQLFAAALTYVLCMEAWVPILYSGMTTGPDRIPEIGAAIVAPVIALALPFFGDMSFLGFVILGFGMYRAFRALAVQPIAVDGPFLLGGTTVEAIEASASDEAVVAPAPDASTSRDHATTDMTTEGTESAVQDSRSGP
jgi:hypothetical protein